MSQKKVRKIGKTVAKHLVTECGSASNVLEQPVEEMQLLRQLLWNTSTFSSEFYTTNQSRSFTLPLSCEQGFQHRFMSSSKNINNNLILGLWRFWVIQDIVKKIKLKQRHLDKGFKVKTFYPLSKRHCQFWETFSQNCHKSFGQGIKHLYWETYVFNLILNEFWSKQCLFSSSKKVIKYKKIVWCCVDDCWRFNSLQMLGPEW